MTLVSSRAPGFFKKIVFDRIDHPDYNFPEIPPAEVRIPLPGVEFWVNPKNRFAVCDLHYTANPAKRGREWAAGVRASMPIRKFMREYEKSWQSFEGLPVFGDFDRSVHIYAELSAEPGLPLLLGWDFGLTPACVISQLVDGNLRILQELTATNESIQTFAPRVWQTLRLNYAPWTHKADEMILSYIDPAGFQRSQTDARTCAQAMQAAGFAKSFPGPLDFETRKESVERFLTKRSRTGQGLQLDGRRCPMLIEGFAGGYQFPPKAIDIEPGKLRPLKNAWSHVHDALQYLAGGAIALSHTYNIDIPTPSYGFQNAGVPKGKLSYG
jgi:hypothetical protein